jgi:hypothetical protein
MSPGFDLNKGVDKDKLIDKLLRKLEQEQKSKAQVNDQRKVEIKKLQKQYEKSLALEGRIRSLKSRFEKG